MAGESAASRRRKILEAGQSSAAEVYADRIQARMDILFLKTPLVRSGRKARCVF